MIWLLLACDPAPAWTYEQAFDGAFEKADANADGSLDRGEWGTSSHSVPRLSDVDQNGDGQLDRAEVQAATLAQDPLTFGGAEQPPAFTDLNADVYHPRPRAERIVHDLLVVLSDELEATGGVPLSTERIDAAARTADLASPETQEALTTLRRGLLGAGLGFPEGLVP